MLDARHVVAFLCAVLAMGVGIAAQPATLPAAEESAAVIARGVEYLRSGISRYRREHRCELCPDIGTAVQALLVAGGGGRDIGASLDETLAVLRDPARWDQGPVRGEIGTSVVARIQLANMLAVAERLNRAPASAVVAAARLVAADQQADGSWDGAVLPTWSARTALVASGRQPDEFVVAQADRWFRGVRVEGVLGAAAVVLGLGVEADVMADRLRAQCLGILRNGQGSSGGWGPGVDDPPQAYDTALVVLALRTLAAEPRMARSTYRPEELREAISQGTTSLVSQPRPDGSWAGSVSTTGWVLLALLM